MVLAVVLAGGSILALGFVFARRASEAALLSREEAASRIQNSSFWEDFFGSIYKRLYSYWQTTLRPQLLGFLAKRVGWFRIFVLHIEHQLFKLAHRIRTSSTLDPKPSAYWQGMHAWRNAHNDVAPVEKDTGRDQNIPPASVVSYGDAQTSEVVIAVSNLPPKRRRVSGGKTSTRPFVLEHAEPLLDEYHL